MSNHPLFVHAYRGTEIESSHLVHAVVTDRSGGIVSFWGDPERSVFPRSAIKCLQALPLVESGAAAALGVTDREIALACASHNGAAIHTEAVANWLQRLGRTPADLECGAAQPLDANTALALARSGEMPGPLHNCCSGKHAGLITTALHSGEPVAGYVAIGHPVQQRLLGVLEAMCVQSIDPRTRGIDGCAIPTFPISLGGLAVGMARFADPVDLPPRRAEAAVAIRSAWSAAPEMVAGDGAFDTELVRATQGAAFAKRGAEGVYTAFLPANGLGIALKAEDGAYRAARLAAAWILNGLGAFDGMSDEARNGFLDTPVMNSSEQVVGRLAVEEP